MRGANIRIAYCNSASGRDYTSAKKFDAGLDAYKAARDQGIQPRNTQRSAVTEALKISDKTGTAFRADQ